MYSLDFFTGGWDILQIADELFYGNNVLLHNFCITRLSFPEAKIFCEISLGELLLTDDCWHFLIRKKHKTQHLIFGTSQPFNREICYSFPFPVRLWFNKNENKEILAGNFRENY